MWICGCSPGLGRRFKVTVLLWVSSQRSQKSPGKDFNLGFQVILGIPHKCSEKNKMPKGSSKQRSKFSRYIRSANISTCSTCKPFFLQLAPIVVGSFFFLNALLLTQSGFFNPTATRIVDLSHVNQLLRGFHQLWHRLESCWQASPFPKIQT